MMPTPRNPAAGAHVVDEHVFHYGGLTAAGLTDYVAMPAAIVFFDPELDLLVAKACQAQYRYLFVRI